MRFLADENFNGKILSGLCTALPALDVIRAQDTATHRAADPDLLAWAADHERILLTHDVQTIPAYAFDRVKAQLPMPGVIIVSSSLAIGQAVDELTLMLAASVAHEFENQVRFIPI